MATSSWTATTTHTCVAKESLSSTPDRACKVPFRIVELHHARARAETASSAASRFFYTTNTALSADACGDLVSNRAYSAIAALAWDLSCWLALVLPCEDGGGRRTRSRRVTCARCGAAPFPRASCICPSRSSRPARLVVRLLHGIRGSAVHRRSSQSTRYAGCCIPTTLTGH
jgi:hypothetical protein